MLGHKRLISSSWVVWVRLCDAENAETPSNPWIHHGWCFQIQQYNKGPQRPTIFAPGNTVPPINTSLPLLDFRTLKRLSLITPNNSWQNSITYIRWCWKPAIRFPWAVGVSKSQCSHTACTTLIIIIITICIEQAVFNHFSKSLIISEKYTYLLSS